MKLVLKCFDDKMLHCFYAMNDWKDWKCIGTQNSGSLSFPEKIKEEFELNHCRFLLDDKENPSGPYSISWQYHDNGVVYTV